MTSRKPSPSLADILKDKNLSEENNLPKNDTPSVEPEGDRPETVTTIEDNDEVIISEEGEGPFANPVTSSGNPVLIDRPGISKPRENDNSLIVPEGEDHVHSWEENQDHNLGRLHPDVPVKPLPAEYAQVASTVAGIDYANENEVDDKFPAGRNSEDEDPGYLEDEDAKNDDKYTDDLI
jgi:hypothetical protein